MKKFLFFLLLFTVYCSLFTFLKAQNLVLNPSFEDHISCPDDYMMLPNNWHTCSGTPDYFNACDDTLVLNSFGVPSNGFGYQYAFDGNAYCGFYSLSFTDTNYKEYLGCRLLNPLIIGQKYYVSFHVIRANGVGVKMATNNIGLLFSTISYQDNNPNSIWGIPTNNFANIVDTNIITDSHNWTNIKGSIIADSAYQYIQIGIFFDVAHIDTLLYGNPIWLNQVAYYFLDEVCVSTDSLTCNPIDAIKEINLKEELINIYPNPTTNDIAIESFPLQAIIEITNIQGQLVRTFATTGDKTNVDVSALPSGVYIIKVATEKGVAVSKFIKE